MEVVPDVAAKVKVEAEVNPESATGQRNTSQREPTTKLQGTKGSREGMWYGVNGNNRMIRHQDRRDNGPVGIT